MNRPLILLLVTGALFLLCTFDNENKEPLTLTRVDGSGDTVSIWPTLTFTCSVPLQENTINLKITPSPGTVYNSYLNSAGDTVTLLVTGSLKGGTLYQISLDTSITAENGSMLYPEDVAFDIMTYPGEIEPNNSRANCDTLIATCFGAASPVNDTDLFYVNNNVATTISLRCHKNRAGFFTTESSGKLLAVVDNLEEVKTFTLTDTVTMPIYIGIVSVSDNDARYEIRVE